MGIDAVHDDPNWSIRAATAVLRMKNTYPQGLRTTADDMSHFFHDQFTVQAPKPWTTETAFHWKIMDLEHEFCDSKGVYNNSALTSVECITPAFLGGQLCILGGKVLGVRGPLIVDSCCLNACLVALYFMLWWQHDQKSARMMTTIGVFEPEKKEALRKKHLTARSERSRYGKLN